MSARAPESIAAEILASPLDDAGESPDILAARWSEEVDAAHRQAAPHFYGLAAVALITGAVLDEQVAPSIAGPLFRVRVALAVFAVLLLVAVRRRRLGGQAAFAAMLLTAAPTFGAVCAFAPSAGALSAASAAYAVLCFLWPPAVLVSRPLGPAVASVASVLVYAAAAHRYSPLPLMTEITSGGYLIVFLATASPFIYAVRYRLLRSNFDLRVELEARNRHIAAQAAELENLASIDGLTGAYNRRVGVHLLEKLIALARRNAQPMAIVFMDVDGLKEVNDTLGHSVGDELIHSLATALEASVRGADVVIRLGGDEFCLGLPNCNPEQAERAVARVQAKLDAYNAEPNRRYAVRVSHGISAYTGKAGDASDVSTLLEQADARMYAAKLERKAEAARRRGAPAAAGLPRRDVSAAPGSR